MPENNAIARPDGSISPFERIKRTNDAEREFWSSREFATVLGYNDYRNFEAVVEKAKLACFNSGQRIEDHFGDVTDMIGVGKGAQRPVKTTYMSRYACYLAIQNADPRKKIVANLCPVRDRILVEEAGIPFPPRPIGTQDHLRCPTFYCVPTGRGINGRAAFSTNIMSLAGQTVRQHNPPPKTETTQTPRAGSVAKRNFRVNNTVKQ